MRRSMLALAAVVALLVTACSSSAPAAPDPYEIAQKAMNAHWDRVQVEVGGTFKSGGHSFTLGQGAIQVVVDSTAGKGLFHLSIPTSALGTDAVALQALGVSGSSIDFDALYDGQALYAKSPVAMALLQQMLAGSAGLSIADPRVWFKLATAAELNAFASSEGAAVPSSGASLDTAGLKKTLNDNGLTLSFVGTETHLGVDANRVAVAIDVEKLSQSSAFDSANQGQVKQLRDALKGGTAKAEFWADRSSGRVTAIDVHITAAGATDGSADISITLGPPPASTSFAAPANAVDLPVTKLLGDALQMFGQSLGQ